MHAIAVSLALLIFALDLGTKWWVKNTASLRNHSMTVIEDFFTIRYVENRGIAFGWFNDFHSEWKPIILSLLALFAILIVLYYILTTPRGQPRLFISFGLLLGGILGNFTDRLSNHYVVDFLEFHWGNRFAWPTFNLADAAITCGVFLILFETFFGKQESEVRSQESGVSTLLILPWLVTPGLPASNAAEIVHKLQAKYETVQSLSADFQQIFRSWNVERKESGILLMKKPGKMYWEYREPARKIFVSNGKKMYFHVPADKQVIVADLAEKNAGAPLLFLLGKGKIQEDFDVRIETSEKPQQPGNVLLRLTPETPQAEFSYLILEIVPSTSLIHRLAVIEPIGNRNDYILTNVRENVSIPDKRFEYKIPSGVEIIRSEN